MVMLAAKARDTVGKGVATLRTKGLLPAVVYGAKTPSQPLTLNAREFEKVWREAGEAGLVELAINGSKKNVLIKDVELHPLRGTPLHVDFYAVEMNKPIRAQVPVQFTGEAPAAKQGAILVKVIHELEVEALPANLPRELQVDISKFVQAGDRFLVSDLSVPAGVTVIAEPSDIIALTEAPKAEEEVVAEAAPSIADIEVVGEKGKKEEEAAKAETPKAE